MKITPNASLFTAISNFPAATDVRGAADDRRKAAGAGVEGSAQRSGDPRDAIRREAIKKAALLKSQETAKDIHKPLAAAQKTSVQAAEPSEPQEALATYTAGSVRREAPFAETKPKFVRLGQFVDIKV